MTPSVLRPLMLLALWLGLNGIIVFILQLCLGIFAPWLTILLSVITLTVLIYKNPLYLVFDPKAWCVLGVTAFFVIMHSLHYPLGGWDAWSCWNLKAKFIYLGQEHFRDMFEPLLWRSNTQYPLLLPSINTWMWDIIGGAHAWGPMVISITLTLLTAAVFLFAVMEVAKQQAAALIMAAAIFLLPFNTTLSAGQYSDILVGLYLLCAFICFYRDDLNLMVVFLGLLSFTKTEGTVAAGILAVLLLILRRDKVKTFWPIMLLSFLPIIIFNIGMAPHNEAFINGLVSSAKPSTLQRLKTVLTYPLGELFSFKWNGLWVIFLCMLAANWKKMTQPRLRIFAIFFAVFLGILLTYYQINTFFEIRWWMDTTLHRILFILMPSLFFWAALSL